MDVADYVAALPQHCPFLEPSVARGMTGWTVYEIVSGARRGAVEAALFYAGVQAAERIRTLKHHQDGVLACENVVFLEQSPDADQRELMAWPHWALKNLYGPVGVMFGKFSRGATEEDRFGRRIPSPPFSFLPARATIRPLDPKFLTDTPDLAAVVAAAEDDGRDVFRDLPCEWKAVREWASSLLGPRRR
ncbi:hypothetical protein [Kitasatospora sp. NPDC093806]|uniref:hypothetical protein n=1 Tax=Kitasatospora sp. NPDC093806 TaxID=3155075 RepID=UPI0034379C9D